MITQRTHTFPGMRNGFVCSGKGTTNNDGEIAITIKGKDYSSKIAGLTLTPELSDLIFTSAKIKSIAYASGVTTITVVLNRIIITEVTIGEDTVGSTEINVQPSTVVHYAMWVDDNTLPTDSTINNTRKQDY